MSIADEIKSYTKLAFMSFCWHYMLAAYQSVAWLIRQDSPSPGMSHPQHSLQQSLETTTKQLRSTLLLGATNRENPRWKAASQVQLRQNSHLTRPEQQYFLGFIPCGVKKVQLGMRYQRYRQKAYLIEEENLEQDFIFHNHDIRQQFEALLSSHRHYVSTVNRHMQAMTANCEGQCVVLTHLIWCSEQLRQKVHRIEVLSFAHFDHVVCVVNRAPGSDLNDHKSWHCLALDPWAFDDEPSKIFSSDVLEEKMRSVCHQHGIPIAFHLKNLCQVKGVVLDVAPNREPNPYVYLEVMPYGVKQADMVKGWREIRDRLQQEILPELQSKRPRL